MALVKVKKKKGESDKQLIDRFRAKVAQKGVIQEVRDKQRHETDAEKRKKKRKQREYWDSQKRRRAKRNN